MTRALVPCPHGIICLSYNILVWSTSWHVYEDICRLRLSRKLYPDNLKVLCTVQAIGPGLLWGMFVMRKPKLRYWLIKVTCHTKYCESKHIRTNFARSVAPVNSAPNNTHVEERFFFFNWNWSADSLWKGLAYEPHIFRSVCMSYWFYVKAIARGY